MSVTYSPGSGTTLPLNSSTKITMRTSYTSLDKHANGTSGVFYWNFYDAAGNALGGSGEVGSTGAGSQTATYTATPSNFIKNGVYPASLKVSGWFCARSVGFEFVDATWPIEEPPRSHCTPPSNPRLSATTTANSATLDWDPGGSGTNNSVTGYVITYQDSSNGTSWGEVNYYGEVSGTTTTVNAANTEGYYRRFGIQTKGTAGYDWLSSVVWSSALRKVTYPTITSQPTLTLGSTSGSSVKLSWNAATVSNQNGATIYYQYFVGPKSTYSDSYCIGQTTSLSITLTEENIISKCGEGFGASTSGSTCYIFVRAYWQASDGSQGDWTTPTGKAFTYLPSLKAPTDVKISKTAGIETTISWKNQKAGNNSQPQAILLIDDVVYATNLTEQSAGYAISKAAWRSYEPGKHRLSIAHEWYGRYAHSSTLEFTYESGLVTYYDGSTPKPCEVYMWDDSKNKFVLCMPYYNDNGTWKKCGC